MRSFANRASVVLLLWLVLLVIPHARAGSSAPSRPPDDERTVGSLIANPSVAPSLKLFETWIEAQMNNQNVPSLSIGIVYDQELIWAKAYGYRNLETKAAASPETIYRIGSITKLFTAIAILQLRDQSKLQLDEPIVKYLPWFKVKNLSSDAVPITVRHLLTHTSGLPSEAAFPYWSDNNFPTREKIKEMLPNQEAIFPPETRLKYSNLGYTLLAEIITAVSGEPYADYINKHILQPLGMSSTSVALNVDPNSFAAGYARRKPDGSRDARPHQDLKGISGAGNMSSTVKDLARFASFIFAGGRPEHNSILKATTIREMQRPQWLRTDWRSGFGLGFLLRNTGEKIYVGHNGELSGFRALLRASPQDRFAVIVLMNSDDSDPHQVADKAFELLAPSVARALAVPPKPSQPDPEWGEYVGKYSDPWGDYQVLVLNNELVMMTLTSADPTASMVRLTPEGKNRFRITARSIDAAANGDLVSFETGPDGKVTRVRVGESYLMRLSQ